MTDHVVVGNIDLGEHLCETLDRSLLIGLSGAEPYITHEDVAYSYLIDFHKVWTSCLLRRQSHAPCSVLRGLSLIITAIEPDCHPCTRISPSPDIKFDIALKDHLVADKLRKSDLPRRLSRSNQKNSK